MVTIFDKVLAIIPARRESKRLPGKNKMRLPGGIELWQNTFHIAREAGIKNIYVSTDDNDILDKISNIKLKSIRILGLKRSADTAMDDASTIDVIHEVMQQVSQHAIQYDTICLLQPTSPLLEYTTLRYAIHQYYSHKYPCLVAVNNHYKPCGAFYILNRDYFYQHGNIWMPGMAVCVVNEKQAIDIDYIWDFRISEAVIKGNVMSQ